MEHNEESKDELNEKISSEDNNQFKEENQFKNINAEDTKTAENKDGEFDDISISSDVLMALKGLDSKEKGIISSYILEKYSYEKNLLEEIEEEKRQKLSYAAEVQNTRRNMTEEVKKAKTYSVTSFAEEMLMIIDSFDACLDTVKKDMHALKAVCGGVKENLKEDFGDRDYPLKEIHTPSNEENTGKLQNFDAVKIDGDISCGHDVGIENIDQSHIKIIEDIFAGVTNIYTELNSSLKKFGVSKIEVVEGETKLDSSKHMVVMNVNSQNHDDNTVAQVMRGGYMIGDRCLRPAMVSVYKKS